MTKNTLKLTGGNVEIQNFSREDPGPELRREVEIYRPAVL